MGRFLYCITGALFWCVPIVSSSVLWKINHSLVFYSILAYSTYMSLVQFTPSVTPDMKVSDITNLAPIMSEVMAEYGLHCYSCEIGGTETLREGMAIHGFSAEVLTALVEDLNDELQKLPKRPAFITITKPAAIALLEISKKEGHSEHRLAILADGQGSFYLEYRDDFLPDEQVFTVKDVPAIEFACNAQTLWQIGGSTIDYRDNVFKLDILELKTCCGAADKSGGSCGCA
jgi:hybrid cluster-associated redox disulfide protein